MPAIRSKSDTRARRLVRVAAILLPAAGLLAATWFGTLGAINAQRQEANGRVVAEVTNQATSVEEQIRWQLLELDQMLRVLAGEWAANPAKFDLLAWHERSVALSGISRTLLLTDTNGVVVQATMPSLLNIDVSGHDYFTYARQHGRLRNGDFIKPQEDPDATYVGAAVSDQVVAEPHIDVARSLRNVDNLFGGVIVAAWRVSAIDDAFHPANLGLHPLMELVGLTDGRLQAVVGPGTGKPGERIEDSPMFAMLRASPDRVWVGRASPNGVVRMLAARTVPGRDLAVVVGVDYGEALAPTDVWAAEAMLIAGGISVLIVVMAGTLTVRTVQRRRRHASTAFDRTMLTAANSQLEVAKTRSDAKTALLEAMLDAMSDGVAIIDPQLCLAQWNRQFPELAGVPRELLRVGLPMADVLRAQAKAGRFGPVDVEAEVARRMALLHSGASAGTVERLHPDGYTIEHRRERLPDGGCITLYADVTQGKQVEDAVRDAGAIAEAATEAKSRFVAIVSHEIHAPLNALLATMTLLHDAGLPPAQQALLDMARQSGDALLGLVGDILETSRIEAGQLTLRPSVFPLHELLDGVVEIFRAQAAERGIALRLAAAPALPRELYADPGRLRQMLINLLSHAVKFGQPGAVGLLAGQEQDANGRPVLLIAVRDRGPMIEPAGRERLFRPFSGLLDGSDPAGEGSLGSGLGLAICRHLVSLMGGQIGCEPWIAEDGHAGNEFWVRLPIAPLPDLRQTPLGTEAPVRRVLPRSRVLLVEDILANQLVTATLLRREGHLVDIAVNGAEALQTVARRPYDLVLMDIFMPGMSGFDVARRIRAMPGPAGTVPIVALTANVSPDDQALCREAGMNRLLPKPVALSDLVQALAELAWRGLPERTTTLRVTVPPHRASVLSAARVGELRNSLPGEMLGGMVEECLIELQARLPTLRRAMESGNSNEVVAEAHAMVGMAAGYGMAALEARLRALMLAARSSDTARAAALAAELDVELSMAANALREALSIEMV
jgi:signal transduction histidine kinase/DNA-binding NarL/FixJ family response regulator